MRLFPSLMFPVALACAHGPQGGSSAPTATRSKATADTAAASLGTLAPGTGIPVGQPAPDVHAFDLDGQPVRLAELTARGPVLLFFYRGGWCPFCNYQLHALAEAAPEFARRGITPVAVSVDRPQEGTKTRALYQIPFPVLSDSELSFIEAFHVVNKVGAAELSRLRGFGMDLEASSGGAHHVIAVPSMFLIDRAGIVRWAHSDLDYKTRPSVAQILAALDAQVGELGSR